ncbi:hypothetical protein J2045_001994 [Peteryoungia aggregata LMG 23059]|uniref:Uncharacterized protein n=1 Tax=Peteryoungia aggregata LMG 23059 TaxID=1368425 RepID=A0ABU0G8G1_9HYPH|nr:hypothetical protein [Peteryoungia aggregata]MDQ0420967.1 hypothetical protein [Peteryoungia aggregata LMG 23059]
METHTDTATTSWLGMARDVSTVGVSASLLLGVSFLTGTCAAIGWHTFGYLTATDIARSALKVSPWLVLAFATAQLLRILVPALDLLSPMPRRDGARGQLSFLRFQFVYALLLLFLAYLFLSARLFNGVAAPLTLAMAFALWDYVNDTFKEGTIDAATRLAANMAILCAYVASVAYLSTSNGILAERKIVREIVCLENSCRDAKVIARFSEATFLQWENVRDITLLMNGEIVSITLKQEQNEGPWIDLRPYFRVSWNWLRGLFGL